MFLIHVHPLLYSILDCFIISISNRALHYLPITLQESHPSSLKKPKAYIFSLQISLL